MSVRRVSLYLLACLCLLSVSVEASTRDTIPPSKDPATEKMPRTDSYGDPLPPGAVARLGTTRFRHIGQPQLMGFAPDGKALLYLAEDGTLRFIDSNKGKILRHLPVVTKEEGQISPALGASRFVLSGDGRMAAAQVGAGEVALLDLATGQESGRIPSEEIVVQQEGVATYGLSGLYLSHDARLLVATSQLGNEKAVLSWVDTVKGKHLHHKFGKNNSRFGAVAISRDGTRIAAVGGYGRGWGISLHIWDVASGKELHTAELYVFSEWPQSIMFLSDNKTLLVHDDKGLLSVVEAATGEVLRRFEEKEHPYHSFALSPDGNLLATGSTDSTVLLWDMAQVLRDAAAPARGLTAGQAEVLWQELGGEAGRAFRAVNTLAQHPETAVALLEERLRPVALPKPGRLQRLAADLGDSRYPVRQQATQELEELNELARPALQKLLVQAPNEEVRRRAEVLLSRLDGLVNSARLLAALRGVEVLERICSPQAHGLLERLAAGAPGHRLTEEARTALSRLGYR